MTAYFDTGVLLKLYTAESDSPKVERFIRRRALPLHLTDLHRAEIAAAFRLKQFRGECSAAQASAALALVETDMRTGALRLVAIDWPDVWLVCRDLANKHAGKAGCRTLDTLHVACALALGVGEFVTTDRRQAALAVRARLRVIDPTQASP
jgi:predicted nucleic acid-binding protein